MNLESLGGGAIAGFFIAALSALGISRKINRLEETKQDKEVAVALQKGIDSKFENIVEIQKEIKTELRDLNNYLRNKINRPD